MHRHRLSLSVRTLVRFLQMFDSESQGANNGNAFSGEEPERSVSVEAMDSDSSSSESRSCLSATEDGRNRIMFDTVMQGVTTGEDIEPLAAVPYRKSAPGSSSTAPVGYRIDHIPLSASTDDDLAQLREAFKIPSSVTMRLPENGELWSA